MRTTIAILFFLFATGLRADDQLPPPPSGYTWQRLPTIKGALMKPDGWFFKSDKKGLTEGFFITMEDIDKSGSFQTGLTLNCVHDVPKTTGHIPSVYAKSLADAAAAKFELKDRSDLVQGPFRGVKFQYVSAPKDKESVTIYQLLIANDKTGTLYMVMLESPTKTWDQTWKTGEVILKKMLIDEGI